ncbi:hypothetical protein CEXT_516211 [Caerostris extrusa]|uniref:Uncharacterized protein n=1 Tax=Caerostris extrusa TaxID=172846 RepID=A0AAV4N8Z3_CAEEX|nr:hypothetical protein CEXT_516211 [Caerostris extrusa]
MESLPVQVDNGQWEFGYLETLTDKTNSMQSHYQLLYSATCNNIPNISIQISCHYKPNQPPDQKSHFQRGSIVPPFHIYQYRLAVQTAPLWSIIRSPTCRKRHRDTGFEVINL